RSGSTRTAPRSMPVSRRPVRAEATSVRVVKKAVTTRSPGDMTGRGAHRVPGPASKSFARGRSGLADRHRLAPRGDLARRLRRQLGRPVLHPGRPFAELEARLLPRGGREEQAEADPGRQPDPETGAHGEDPVARPLHPEGHDV